MDLALQEMKSFLRKLECKQAHIELDNLKIQKHINTLRESLEGVKEIKDKIEQMTRNNLEQEKLIKDLKVQIIKLKKKQKNETFKTDSYVKEIDKSFELGIPSQSYDKNKSNLMKVFESNLFLPEADSEYGETYNRQQEKKEMDHSYRNSHSTAKSHHSDYSYVFHTVDEEILDRYLKDSAKFRDDAVSDEENNHSGGRTPKQSENGGSEDGTGFKGLEEVHVKNRNQYIGQSMESMGSKLNGHRKKRLNKNGVKKCRRKMARNNHLVRCKSKGEKGVKVYNSKHCSDRCSIREVFRNRRKR